MLIVTCNRSFSRRPFALLGGLVGGAFALSVLLATPALAAPDDAKPPTRGEDLLGGPKVDDAAGKDERAFGKDGKPGKPGKAGEQGARRPMVKVRLWMETMRTMELAPEQREKVDAVVARFHAERDAFEKEHGETRRALEKTVKENGPDTAEGKEARQAMKALVEKAPKPEAFQAEAFALLTPDQQEAFKKRLAEREAKMREAAESKGADGKGGRPGDGTPRRKGKAGEDARPKESGPSKEGGKPKDGGRSKDGGKSAPPMTDEPMR